MAELFTFIGFLAGFLTTLSFVPQALHSWKSKSAGDFSWLMLIAFSAGITMWFVYGVYLHNWPMILANAATLLFIMPVIFVKLRHPAPKR
jgi:MtN3 and saliva related transmembrane protein